MRPERHPIRKKDSRWLLYFFAAGLAVASVFILEVAMLSVFASGLPTFFRVAAVVVPAIVLAAVLLIFLIGTKIVPWRYTIFGPYERSPVPKGFQPHIQMSVEPHHPHFITRYEVGKEGIELTYHRGTRAFLPSASITAIGPATWRTYVVEHDCPEIEGPLVVSQEVGEAIIAGLGRADLPA